MNADMEKKSIPMRRALEEAVASGARGEIPVGAVVTDKNGHIIAVAGNETRKQADPTAHAELLAIRQAAAKLGVERLTGCTLYVTLEPCAMCAGAIAHARLDRLVFGAYDPKGGAVDHGPRFFEQPTCLHRPEVAGGVDAEACGSVLKEFFANLR